MIVLNHITNQILTFKVSDVIQKVNDCLISSVLNTNFKPFLNKINI